MTRQARRSLTLYCSRMPTISHSRPETSIFQWSVFEGHLQSSLRNPKRRGKFARRIRNERRLSLTDLSKKTTLFSVGSMIFPKRQSYLLFR
jgi:hypothetical protein